MENSTLFVLVAFLLLLVANSSKAATVHGSAGTSTGDYSTSRLDLDNVNNKQDEHSASDSSHLYPTVMADAWSAIQDSTTSLYHSILAAAATAAAGGAELATSNVDSTTTGKTATGNPSSLRGPGSFVIVHPQHRDHSSAAAIMTSYQSHRTGQLELTELHRMMQDSARLVAKLRFELEASEAKHTAELEEAKAQVAQERNKSNDLARQLEEERDTRAKGERQTKAEMEKLERKLRVEAELSERRSLSLIWAQIALSREREAHNETKQALEREAKEHEKARLAWRLHFLDGSGHSANNRTEAHYEEWLASSLASSSSSSTWRLPQWAVPLNLTATLMASLLVWTRTMHSSASSASSRGRFKPKAHLKHKKKSKKHSKADPIELTEFEEDVLQTEQETVVTESTAAARMMIEEESKQKEMADEIEIADVQEHGSATSDLKQVMVEDQQSEANESYEVVEAASEEDEEKEHVEPGEIDEDVINVLITSEVETAANEGELLVNQQDPDMSVMSADETQTTASSKHAVHFEAEPEQPSFKEQEEQVVEGITSASIVTDQADEEEVNEEEKAQPERSPRRIDQEMRLMMEELDIPWPPVFIENESDQVWWLEGYIEAADKYLRLIEELNEAAATSAAANAAKEPNDQKEEKHVQSQREQQQEVVVEEEDEVEEEDQNASSTDRTETISCEGRSILHDGDPEDEDDHLQTTTASQGPSSSFTFSSSLESSVSATSIATPTVADSTSEQSAEQMDRTSSCQLGQADPPGVEALEVKYDDIDHGVDDGDDDARARTADDEEHWVANDETHESTTPTRTADDEAKRAFLSALFESLLRHGSAEKAELKSEFQGFAPSDDSASSSSSDRAPPAADDHRQQKGKEKVDQYEEEEEEQERKPFLYFGDEDEFHTTNDAYDDEIHNPPSDDANTAETEEHDHTTDDGGDGSTSTCEEEEDDVFREPIYRPWWYAEDYAFTPPPSSVEVGEVEALTSETGALQCNARGSAFERFMALHWVLSAIKTNECPTLREPPALIMCASVSHHPCMTWVVNGRAVGTGEVVTKDALKAGLRKLMLRVHPDRHARHWWMWLADEWTREISDLYDRLQSASQAKQLYEEHHAEVSAWQSRILQAALEQQIQAAMERQRQRDEELNRMMQEQAAHGGAESTRPATPPEARRKVKVRRRRTAQQ